jgi:hypothetical protein
MLGNDQYGDCVSAEEGAALEMYSVMVSSTEIVVPDATVEQWAQAHGVLNGAVLTDVLDWRQKDPITVNGVNYLDGPYASVDWTNQANLSSAIYTGPVKLGIAAGPLQGLVQNQNGWFLTGASKDNNQDHCVGLWGYGTATDLYKVLNVPLPSGLSGTTFGYLLYTWSTVGFIDQPSLNAISGEAWLRTPTIVGLTPPAPPPPPPPGPGPTTGIITIDMGAQAISAPSGWVLVPTS